MSVLPFRFFCTAAVATRWDKLRLAEKQQLWQDFIAQQGNGSCMPADDATLTRVFWPEDKDDVSYDVQARSAFSCYVASRLASKRELRELTQTAQWARDTGRRHRLEVVCDAGRIDVLFDDGELVEAKIADGWKHALGQVLVYAYCLNSKRMRVRPSVLLLGKRTDYDYRLIEACCDSLGVTVHWL